MERKLSENSLVVTVRALLTTMSALQSVITASKSNWLLNTLPLQRVTAKHQFVSTRSECVKVS